MKALFGSLSVLPQDIFFQTVCSDANTSLWHSWVPLCLTDSQTQHWAEHGSSGGTREEDYCRCSQRNLGNILLPSVSSIGKGNNPWRIIITVLYSFLINQHVYVCVQGSVGTGVQVLSVSHSGIKLLKTVKSSAAAPDYFRVLRSYTCVQFVFLCLLSSLFLSVCESVCCVWLSVL